MQRSMDYPPNTLALDTSDLDPNLFLLPSTTAGGDPGFHAAHHHHLGQPISPYSELHTPIAPPGPKRRYPPPAACLPCRNRKVKCNHLLPCSTCIERDHPEACVYKAPTKKPKVERTSRASSSGVKKDPEPKDDAGESWHPSKEDWMTLTENLSSLKKEITQLRAESAASSRVSRASDGDQYSRDGYYSQSSDGHAAGDGDGDRMSLDDLRSKPHSASGSALINGFHATDHLTDVYLGGNSAPALVAALQTGGRDMQGRLRDPTSPLGNNLSSLMLVNESEMLPTFILGNESATYPFVDLFTLQFGPHEKLRRLYGMIPEDAECIRLFKHYRDTAHVLFPGVVDVASFETELSNFLSKRHGISPKASDQELFSLFGESLEMMHFVGLLLAVLASGSQCSDVSRVTTEPRSQIFVCGAYECLRSVNYLSRSNLIDIQTLLVLGNVISNNWDSGVAWSLLGITGRLAQGQGLDHEPPPKLPIEQKLLRNKVWQRVIWQDCLLSMTYDRTSGIADYTTDRTSSHEPLSYSSALYEMCNVGLDLLKFRATSSSRKEDQNLKALVRYQSTIHEIYERTVPHLRDKNRISSMKEQLEYHNLLMHKSYFLSEIGRPTLKLGTYSTRLNYLVKDLQDTCVNSLKDTVQAFLGLQNISKFACHSWAAVHRALSSALLLAIIGKQNESAEVKNLLVNLVSVMTATISEVDPSVLVTPITRAVEWLKRFIPEQKEMPRGPGNMRNSSSTYTMTNIPSEGNCSQATTQHFQGNLTSSGNAEASRNNPYSMVESILYGKQGHGNNSFGPSNG